MNKIIENLKTEAIEPRHWEIILKKMKVYLLIWFFFFYFFKKKKKKKIRSSLNELTLGFLWKDELILKFEKPIEEVIVVAQGEFVLKCMIKGVKDFWN